MSERDDTRRTVYRGDDQEWTVALFANTSTGDPLPLRDVTIVVTAKPPGRDGADDSDALFRHTIVFDAAGSASSAVGFRLGGTDPDTGVDVVDVDAGIVTEFLTPADVVALAAAYDDTKARTEKRIAVWDMRVTDARGQRKTVRTGDLYVRPDIGRRDLVP